MASTGYSPESKDLRQIRRITAVSLVCMVSLPLLLASACGDTPALADGPAVAAKPSLAAVNAAGGSAATPTPANEPPKPTATLTPIAVFNHTATPTHTATASPAATPAPAAQLEYASVNVRSLILRKSASSKAGTVAAVYSGEVVRILETQTVSGAVWHKVAATSGKVGWCQTRYLGLQADGDAIKPTAEAMLDYPSDYIDFTQPLTLKNCMQDMREIAAAYPGLARVETIGASVMGTPIEAIVLGNPEAETKIFVHAAIHGREFLTAWVALRQAETILKASALGVSYKETRVSDMLAKLQIWIVPFANPDGVQMATEGLDALPSTMPEIKEALLKINRGSQDFRYWKANAHGVDLNANFEVGWNKNPKRARKPSRENYPGPSPLSEPESKALYDLTVREDFDFVLAYHASGGLIYWSDPENSGAQSVNRQIVKRLSKLNRYTASFLKQKKLHGGFRDWFVSTYNRPGFTVEHGKGSFSRLPVSKFPTIWKENRFLLLEAALIETTMAPQESAPAATPQATPGSSPSSTPAAGGQ